MGKPSPFCNAEGYSPLSTRQARGVELPATFSAAADEYRRAREGVALYDRSDRVIAIVTGNDRKSWLHNLTTNDIKKLSPDHGCYTFVIDVRGRTQCDLNVLDRDGVLWLDLDREIAPSALAFLDRYLISEDVRLRLAEDDFARLGVSGSRAADVAERLGVAGFSSMAPLRQTPLDDAVLFRHDFSGLPGFELIVPAASAASWWRRLAIEVGCAPAGHDTLNVLRIEAGIPWIGADIDDRVIPPETGQTQRGVSYHKGCYLGQEVLERMRSHNVLARRLTRLRMSDGAGVELPSPLLAGEREAGRLTSLAKHPVEPGWVGLGYFNTKAPDQPLTVAGRPVEPLETALPA